jgi:EAL domain-containing protein (putative c-di-GMP-specific phosphodiesterase class I)
MPCARLGWANRLQLEVTESLLLQDDETNMAVLQELRGIGISIAMDDFGTGYSSLSYLRKISFDKIKIDRFLVSDLPDGDGGEAIVRAIIGPGRSLGFSTTAEGIETAAQLELVRAQGCVEAQGFFFISSVSGEDVPALLERRWPRTSMMAIALPIRTIM